MREKKVHTCKEEGQKLRYIRRRGRRRRGGSSAVKRESKGERNKGVEGTERRKH